LASIAYIAILNFLLSLYQVLDEAARSLHDALCVIRCLVNERFLIAGLSYPKDIQFRHYIYIELRGFFAV
jgi:hypothetical protein